ncbi:unnamed protein product, partial [marine sediment metagenome]
AGLYVEVVTNMVTKVSNTKKIRIQFTKREVWRLRNLLAGQYYFDRRNLRWEKKRIARGKPDSRVYPVALQEKHLNGTRRLLKKLSKAVGEKQWFVR